MGRHSGEQSRRARATNAQARYAQVMATRDKLRMVHALRCAANRLEAEAKGEATVLAFRRGDETAGLAVTDHAVVRFLERVVGYDVDAIRAQITRLIPASALPQVPGSPGICVRDGFQFLLTSNAIISVLTAEMDGRKWLERDELQIVGAA